MVQSVVSELFLECISKPEKNIFDRSPVFQYIKHSYTLYNFALKYAQNGVSESNQCALGAVRQQL